MPRCAHSEAMLMIVPSPAGSMYRAACCAQTNGAVRFVSRTLRHSSSGSSSEGAADGTPALLMRMSRRPTPSTAAAIRRSAPSGSRRSASTAMTRSAASSRAAASARAWVRELTTTNAPLAARRRATASPMPADDPVTTATLSSRASAASAANAGMPASDGIRQRGRVLQRGHRAGHHGAVHAADHLAVLDAGGLVVAGQEPVRGLEGLLHGGLLL